VTGPLGDEVAVPLHPDGRFEVLRRTTVHGRRELHMSDVVVEIGRHLHL